MEELALEELPTVARPEFRVSVDIHISQRNGFNQQYLDLLMMGDSATEMHFTSYFEKLLTLKLRSRVWSKELIEDVRQETFLRVLHVLRRRRGIQVPERFGAFVKAVCDNVLLEFFRPGSYDRRVLDCDFEHSSPEISVEAALMSKEQKAFIRVRLKTLSTTDQEMLRKVFLEERDKDEICVELGISRNNLRTRIHRALQRFRSAIAADNQ